MSASANETYVVMWGSSADSGSQDQGIGGNAGGGSTWDRVRGDANKGGLAVSTAESLHTAADLPAYFQAYSFFNAIPTNPYGYMFAIGSAATVGVNTSKTSTKNNPPGKTGTSASASTSGYTLPSLPSIGNLVLVFVTTRGGVTAATPTDSSGEAYSLVFAGAGPGGVNNYLWSRVAAANDSAFVVTSTLSASATWVISTCIIDTPSSTRIYKLDERAFVNNGGNPLKMTMTDAAHVDPLLAQYLTGFTSGFQ